MKQFRKRYKGPRPLGEFAPAALTQAAAQLGFGESDIILHWPDIAGERLAQVSEPEKLQWPVKPKKADPTGPEPAGLVLRVESAFAIEIQHLAPLLIQRINTRLGWRCVGRILIRQGPVRRRAPARGKVPPPDPAALAQAAKLAASIETEDLRDALTRLGARALASGASPKDNKTSGAKASPNTAGRPPAGGSTQESEDV